jgi:hypothetical protein
VIHIRLPRLSKRGIRQTGDLAMTNAITTGSRRDLAEPTWLSTGALRRSRPGGSLKPSRCAPRRFNLV